MKEILDLLHNRHKKVRDRYGHTVGHIYHCGEGIYFGSFAFGLSHEFIGPLYVGLFVVWLGHTIIVGLE